MHGVIGDQFSLVHAALSAMTPAQARRILEEVAAKHGVPVESLKRGYCYKQAVEARHEVVYRIRIKLGWSWSRIGRFLDRDHTTCIYAYRRHAAKHHGGQPPKMARSKPGSGGQKRPYRDEAHRAFILGRQSRSRAERIASDPAFAEVERVRNAQGKMRMYQQRLIMALL